MEYSLVPWPREGSAPDTTTDEANCTWEHNGKIGEACERGEIELLLYIHDTQVSVISTIHLVAPVCTAPVRPGAVFAV